MRERDNKKPEVFIGESRATDKGADYGQEAVAQGKLEQFKKPAILVLMVIVFLGCMYMIFSPSKKSIEKESIGKGLNELVPQATEPVMPTDKGKAYEEELLKQKDEAKRSALTALSDYWQEQKAPVDSTVSPTGHSEYVDPGTTGFESYQKVQQTLGSFYEQKEESHLKKEIESLKRQLADKTSRPNTTHNPLAFMEKSYEMASKYFPITTKRNDTVSTTATSEKEMPKKFRSVQKGVVSALPRQGQKNEDVAIQGDTVSKNSIRACVNESQNVTAGNPVQLRLLEAANTSGQLIPEGTLLTAFAKFDGGRLQLQVTSIEVKGNIIPVKLTVYDRDGQKGLNIPYNPEINAVNQIASNMGASGGTNIMLTRSAGQQVAADLSKGVVQGVSGYFTKKVRIPKVQLPASYQVFLVSKK